MDGNGALVGGMFAALCIFLLLGFPVAFTLSGVALGTAIVAWLTGGFDFGFLTAMPLRVFGIMTNEVLVAVPVFVMMGVILERSKVAEDLLDTMGQLFGSLRGGLGISVTVVGALLAASTGIVGASVVTMGLLSLPTMLRRGYNPSLACGTICSSGTLGQIIPPSIVLIILGDQISNAYVEAQRQIGNWSPEPVSVGDLFAGALLPGLLLVALYILYQVLVGLVRPGDAPAVPKSASHGVHKNFFRRVVGALLPPISLIVAVLGSILTGVATPTEAASVGAAGAVFLAAMREGMQSGRRNTLLHAGLFAVLVIFVCRAVFDLRLGRTQIDFPDMLAITVALAGISIAGLALAVGLWRLQKSGILLSILLSTLQTTCMVFVILIGAALLSLVFRGLGGDDMIHEFLTSLPGGMTMALIIVMAVMFLLGFFLDYIEITFVVVPIVAPILLMGDISPVWLGVLMAMNLQTSFLTPPFGFSLFYLRGVAPETVTTTQIYRGVTPFVLLQLLGMALLALFPALATWLPKMVFG